MAKLDAASRNALPDKEFAGPDRSYPIPDKSHAQNALSRVSANGSPEEKAMVREKVHNKYPGMGKDDPEHKALKAKLGVQEHEDIPQDTMKDAMDGKHGPDIQSMAHSVHGRMRAAHAEADDQRASDMDDVFGANRAPVGKDNAAKPMAPNRPPMAPSRDDRYDFGD
jgi:hypothetical protein